MYNLDYKNSKFICLIDNIAIHLWSSWNFASIKKKNCNQMVDLSKLTSSKKILSGVVALIYSRVCRQILSRV